MTATLIDPAADWIFKQVITAAARINTIHDRVRGRVCAGAGEAYSAHGPDLQRWVRATLIESIPLTYELLVGPLTLRERDRYCSEAAIMEPLLGMPAGCLPRDPAQLDIYIREMLAGGRIVVTDTSRALARAVLYPPHRRLVWTALLRTSLRLLRPLVDDSASSLLLENILDRNAKRPCNQECQFKRRVIFPPFQRNYGLTSDSDTIGQSLLSHLATVESQLANAIRNDQLMHQPISGNRLRCRHNRRRSRERIRRTTTERLPSQ